MSQTDKTQKINQTNSKTQSNGQAKNSNRKQVLKPSDPIPEDVHWEWIEVVKALQAACRDNQGFAKLTLNISVHRNKPILWAPPDVVECEQEEATRAKYHVLSLSPKRVADYRFTSTTAAALMAMNEEG